MTLKQAELMGSRSIIPMIVVELELDTVEVLKRGIVDKMKPNKSENTATAATNSLRAVNY